MTRRMFVALTGIAAAGALGPAACAAAAQTPPTRAQDKKDLDLVLAMAAAWKTLDAKKIAEYMHDDIWMRGAAHIIETPPRKGKKDFIQAIGNFLAPLTKTEMIITDAFALNSLVVACHHHLYESPERGAHECMDIGVFFIQDGLIREWNDYVIIPYAQPRQTGTAARGKFLRTPA